MAKPSGNAYKYAKVGKVYDGFKVESKEDLAKRSTDWLLTRVNRLDFAIKLNYNTALHPEAWLPLIEYHDAVNSAWLKKVIKAGKKSAAQSAAIAKMVEKRNK